MDNKVMEHNLGGLISESLENYQFFSNPLDRLVEFVSYLLVVAMFDIDALSYVDEINFCNFAKFVGLIFFSALWTTLSQIGTMIPIIRIAMALLTLVSVGVISYRIYNRGMAQFNITEMTRQMFSPVLVIAKLIYNCIVAIFHAVTFGHFRGDNGGTPPPGPGGSGHTTLPGSQTPSSRSRTQSPSKPSKGGNQSRSSVPLTPLGPLLDKGINQRPTKSSGAMQNEPTISPQTHSNSRQTHKDDNKDGQAIDQANANLLKQ